MTVLLAGCGDLGTAVGLRFATAGQRVIGVRRSAQLLPDAFERQAVDLRVAVPVVPADTAIVVVALAAGERSAAAYRATYLDGLAHVLDGVDASGASPLVLLVSSTAVYGVTDGSVVDENTPAEPPSETAAVLLEAEQLLASRAPRATALRLGGIYGPGRERLITTVREGRAGIPTHSLHTNRIHRDDAARAILHLATAVAEPAPVYLGVDDEPAQYADVVRFLAAELGVPEPDGSVDAPREGGGDKRCSNALLRSTGFVFTYPSYREGYRALLAR
jgi:nucleoside-diphosphate-sugar epimerase